MGACRRSRRYSTSRLKVAREIASRPGRSRSAPRAARAASGRSCRSARCGSRRGWAGHVASDCVKAWYRQQCPRGIVCRASAGMTMLLALVLTTVAALLALVQGDARSRRALRLGALAALVAGVTAWLWPLQWAAAGTLLLAGGWSCLWCTPCCGRCGCFLHFYFDSCSRFLRGRCGRFHGYHDARRGPPAARRASSTAQLTITKAMVSDGRPAAPASGVAAAGPARSAPPPAAPAPAWHGWAGRTRSRRPAR